MNRPISLLTSLTSTFALAACTVVPLSQVAQCTECAGPQTVTGIAVTRPSLCNDFPVTYRAQTPESKDRIRFVDHPTLQSNRLVATQLNAGCQGR